MSYEVYWGAGSPNAWRVLLALEVKGLKYDSKLIQFSKNEHASEKMLAMNPRGRIPVLKDGEVVVYESIAIIAYLDKKHPAIPLFGTSPAETGLIWQRIFEFQNYVCEPITGIVRPVFQDCVVENMELIKNSAQQVTSEYEILDRQLAQSDYVAGETLSAADIVLLPFILALSRAMVLEEASSLELKFDQLDELYPNLCKWIKRIESIPGYDNTFPPNWKE